MSKAETKSKVINYCVGHPWPSHPESICVYAFGTQVQTGTIEDAEVFRKYVNEQTGEENYIYQLVKVEE